MQTPQKRPPGGSAPPGSDQALLLQGADADTADREALLKKLLPPGRAETLTAEFRRDWPPQTSLEELLLREAGRHAAALEFFAEAEPAVLRHAAANPFTDLAWPAAGNGQAREDRVIAATLSSRAFDDLSRWRVQHEKALHRTLDLLRALRERRRQSPPVIVAEPTPLETEQDCKNFLARRFHEPGWKCPRCGHAQGNWIDSRKRWDCRKCDKEVTLRYGTVMAKSPLPLKAWFTVITVVLTKQKPNDTELARALGLPRPKTIGEMIERIRTKLKDHGPVGLLGGLDPGRLLQPASGFLPSDSGTPPKGECPS